MVTHTASKHYMNGDIVGSGQHSLTVGLIERSTMASDEVGFQSHIHGAQRGSLAIAHRAGIREVRRGEIYVRYCKVSKVSYLSRTLIEYVRSETRLVR